MEEFWVQGDKVGDNMEFKTLLGVFWSQERELGLDMSPMCDRNNPTVEKSQVGKYNSLRHPQNYTGLP